jgi:hypothetical protein
VMFHSPNGVALPAFRHAKPILGNEIVRVRASPTLALWCVSISLRPRLGSDDGLRVTQATP